MQEKKKRTGFRQQRRRSYDRNCNSFFYFRNFLNIWTIGIQWFACSVMLDWQSFLCNNHYYYTYVYTDMVDRKEEREKILGGEKVRNKDGIISFMENYES